MLDADLERAFDTLVVDVEHAATAPGANRARGTLRARRTVLAAVVAVAVLGGGVAVGVSTGADPAPEPAPPTTQREGDDAAVADSRPVLPTTPVDGLWHTRYLTPGEIETLLTRAGAPDVLAAWRDHAPAGRPRLTLTANPVRGLGLWLGTDRRPWVQGLDWGMYAEHGDDILLRYHHRREPTASLRPDIRGSRLTFDVVRTTWPASSGVSGRDRAEALYTSLPFTRFYGDGS